MTIDKNESERLRWNPLALVELTDQCSANAQTASGSLLFSRGLLLKFGFYGLC